MTPSVSPRIGLGDVSNTLGLVDGGHLAVPPSQEVDLSDEDDYFSAEENASVRHGATSTGETSIPSTPNVIPPTPVLDDEPASPDPGENPAASVPPCACYACLTKGLVPAVNVNTVTSQASADPSPPLPADWHTHALLLSFCANPLSPSVRLYSGRLTPASLAPPLTDRFGHPLPQVHHTVSPEELLWKIWTFPLENPQMTGWRRAQIIAGEGGVCVKVDTLREVPGPGAPGGWEGTEWMDRWDGWLKEMCHRVTRTARHVIQAIIAQYAVPHSGSLHPLLPAQVDLLPYSYATLAQAQPALYNDVFDPPPRVGKGVWLGHMYLNLYWQEWALREIWFLLAFERGLKNEYGMIWMENVGSGSVMRDVRERKASKEMGVADREQIGRIVKDLEENRERVGRLSDGAASREAHAGLATKYLAILAEMIPDVPVPFFATLYEVEGDPAHSAWLRTWEQVHLALANLIVRTGIDPFISIYLKNVVLRHPWHTFGFRAVIERDAIAAYTAHLPTLTDPYARHRTEFILSAMKRDLENILSHNPDQFGHSPPQEEYTFHQVLSCAADRGEIALCPIEPDAKKQQQGDDGKPEEEGSQWYADPDVDWDANVTWKIRTEAGWFWIMMPKFGSKPTVVMPEDTWPKRRGSNDSVKRAADEREGGANNATGRATAPKRVRFEDIMADEPSQSECSGETTGLASAVRRDQPQSSETGESSESFDPLRLSAPHGPATWTTASTGLSERLIYMNYDLWDYAHTLDESKLYRLTETERSQPRHSEVEFGTHRLPNTRRSRTAVLWSVWRSCFIAEGPEPLPDFQQVLENTIGLRRDVLLRLFQRIRRFSLLPDWQRSFQAPMNENGEPLSDTGNGYFPTHPDRDVVLLKETVFFLRQVQLVQRYLLCLLGVENGLTGVKLVKGRKGSAWARLRSKWKKRKTGRLSEALEVGTAALCHAKAAIEVEKDRKAAETALEGLVRMAPFYPSEHWIAAWESKRIGLTDLHHELLLLLGQICKRHQLVREAGLVAQTLQEHPFVCRATYEAAFELLPAPSGSVPIDSSPTLSGSISSLNLTPLGANDLVHPPEGSTFSLNDVLRLCHAQADFTSRPVPYSTLDKDVREREVLIRNEETGTKWVASVAAPGEKPSPSV